MESVLNNVMLLNYMSFEYFQNMEYSDISQWLGTSINDRVYSLTIWCISNWLGASFTSDVAYY